MAHHLKWDFPDFLATKQLPELVTETLVQLVLEYFLGIHNPEQIRLSGRVHRKIYETLERRDHKLVRL